MTRLITWTLSILWDGSTYSQTTTDSARLIAASGSYALNPPGISSFGGRGMVSSASFTLSNHDGRYSADGDGAMSAYMANNNTYQMPISLVASIGDGTSVQLFNGVIKSVREQSPTAMMPGSITIEARTKEDLYLNRRQSTSVSAFAEMHDESYTESDIMGRWLDDAGLNDGQYTLDPGMFRIPFAWLDDESLIEECWLLAAACGGRFYGDANGDLVYENATHWLKTPHTTVSTAEPDNAFTRDDFTEFEMWWDDSDLYKNVTVEYSGRIQSGPDVVWEPEEDITVPADDSVSVTASFRQPAYSISGISYTAATVGGIDITSDVTATFGTQSAQRATVTFANANTTYAARLHNVVISGVPVTGGPDGEVTESSTDTFWAGRTPRDRSIRANLYVQTRPHAGMIAGMLADVQGKPRRMYRLSGVPGDPRRKVGDRISITDSHTSTNVRYGYVVDLNWSLSGGLFTNELTAIDAGSLYTYADAEFGYFVIGTNELGDSAPYSNRGRLFY